jgi:hypothetical protein
MEHDRKRVIRHACRNTAHLPLCPLSCVCAGGRSSEYHTEPCNARFRQFLLESWNLFDFLVVFISVISLVLDGENVKSIRLLRILRKSSNFLF